MNEQNDFGIKIEDTLLFIPSIIGNGGELLIPKNMFRSHKTSQIILKHCATSYLKDVSDTDIILFIPNFRVLTKFISKNLTSFKKIKSKTCDIYFFYKKTTII